MLLAEVSIIGGPFRAEGWQARIDEAVIRAPAPVEHASMIPAPLFSGTFVFLFFASIAATFAVLGWAIALASVADVRRAFRRRWRLTVPLMVLLCAISSFFVALMFGMWQVQRESEREQAALHPTLAASTRLIGIDMPVGTKLSFARGGDRTTPEAAQFPRPVLVYGVLARAVTVSSGYDADAPPGQRPANLIELGITAAQPQTVDGWACGTSEPIRVVLRGHADVKTLQECNLAAGNTVAGEAVPAGSTVMRYTTTYGDGLRENDYWRIEIPHNSTFILHGVPMAHPDIKLDKQHRLVAFESGELQQAFTLGDAVYAAGTDVASAGRGLREKYPGALVFSPADGRPARIRGKGPVAEPMAVIQAPDGTVYGTFKNALLAQLRSIPQIVVDKDTLAE